MTAKEHRVITFAPPYKLKIKNATKRTTDCLELAHQKYQDKDFSHWVDLKEENEKLKNIKRKNN